MTKSSDYKVPFLEGAEGIGLETAAILASASPLGIITMGVFPSSLIAWGKITRRHFDNTLTLCRREQLARSDRLTTPR